MKTSSETGLNLPKLKAEAAAELRSDLLLKALKYVERTAGTALGIAMSGADHLNPDEVLEKLSQDGIALSAEIRAGIHKAQAIHPCAANMPTTTTRKGAVGRRMWGGPVACAGRRIWFTVCSKRDDKIFCDFTRPVLVLDLSPAALQELRERIIPILAEGRGPSWDESKADAILRALTATKGAGATEGKP